MVIRGRWLALVGAAVALGSSAVVAYADSINGDGDVLKPNNNISYTDAANFTQHCTSRGTPLVGSVTVKFNGTKHYDPGATITLTATPDAAGLAAGITTTSGTATVPTPWDTAGQTFSGPISTTVPPTVPNGTYTVTVTASGAAHDGHGDPLTLDATDTYDVSVSCANITPVISWVASPSSANEGDLETYQLSITDPDSTSWLFASGYPSCGSAGSLSGAPSIDSSAKTGTFTCGFPNGPATSTVTVAVSDGTTSNGLTQPVAVANVAPAVAFTSAPPTAFEGETKTYAFSVSDPGVTDTYSAAAGFPSCGSGGTLVAGSLALTGNHGAQTGSFACKFPSPGAPTVSIAFTDSDGATGNTATATVTVQDAPLTAGALAITNGVESLTASQLTFGFTDANPAGAAGDYAATIDWGDSTNSAGTVTASGVGFSVHASHTYVEEGTYAVTVTVADVGGATTAAAGSAIVGDAPLTAGTLTVGNGVAGVTPAPLAFAFTDANPAATASDFTATIDWGDSTSSAGTVAASSTGFSAQGSHTYAHAGTYTVTVTVTDVGGSTASATGSTTITAPPLTAGTLTIGAGVEGVTASPLTFGFTDGNPLATAADFTATITWGDSTTSAGTVTAAGGGFTATDSHTYADEGSYPVSVTVTNTGGSTTSASGPATVADAPLAAGALTIGTGVAGVTAAPLTFSFTDANPAAPVSDFTATINWGDSTTSTGTITAAGGGFTVQGSHTYSHSGTFTVAVAVDDGGGSTTSTTGSAVIASAPLTAGALKIGSGVEGVTLAPLTFAFTSSNPLATAADFSATITWGDSTTSTGTVTAVIGGGFSVQGSHLYKEEDSYAVSITVVDGAGGTVAAMGHANVGDAPLTASAPALPNTPGSFSGTTAAFTDANPFATVSDYSVRIDWGDGDHSNGTVVASGGAWTVRGSHSFDHTGYYAIKTKITDDGGSIASASAQILIFAFLQRGAFVIGDRSATGNVTFWSPQWWKKNSLSGGTAPASFKGFAADPQTPTCDATWTSGWDDDAPNDHLPDYMAVIVTGSVTKSGSRTTGNTARMVIVRTSSGHHHDDARDGTGTVVGSVPGC